APAVAEFHKDLGVALRAVGRIDDAIRAHRRAIELRADFAEPYFHLGNLLQSQGKLDEAISAFRRLIELEPELAEGYVNLGNALLLKNELFEADLAYQRALDFNPELPRAYSNRALLQLRQQQFDAAADSSRRAIALAPGFPEAHNNLGTILMRQGLIDDALASFRQAGDLAPGYQPAHSNRLFALHYHPRFSPLQILQEHREWAQSFADPLTAQASPHDHDRDPQRPLRIGYISPDLRDHPVGRLSGPLLANHDRTQFEVHVFSDIHEPDEITRQLMAHTDHWHQTPSLSNPAVAELIRACGIDILIDLGLHSADNRLLALALKPAPVQLTYLAYPGTSGMAAMDYRLTDARLDPPGNESFYSEKSVRLDHYWCYNPPDDAPDVGALPAVTAGHVTFGCLNSPSKLSEPALLLFSELLDALPGSRLLLHAHPGTHPQRILRTLASSNNIHSDRIEFVPNQSHREYLNTYNRIDIALDPFPFAGGATTCDALYMGAPVVTLAGQIATGRFGVTFLSALGEEKLIAQSHAQYLQIAAGLASDLPRLAGLRASLRQRMTASALLDCPAFTRDFERALREIWRTHCQIRA
ncbi:MAG: tetratricopeptide repeat protein, partial [Gemmatimonadaceae bacterium]|nr:tetratricopeptide repeat protein [Gemmatimonadaceae bacterium]